MPETEKKQRIKIVKHKKTRHATSSPGPQEYLCNGASGNTWEHQAGGSFLAPPAGQRSLLVPPGKKKRACLVQPGGKRSLATRANCLPSMCQNKHSLSCQTSSCRKLKQTAYPTVHESILFLLSNQIPRGGDGEPLPPREKNNTYL